MHVRDVARANLLALSQPDVPSGAYNVASGTPHTVLELARALCRTTADPQPAVTRSFRLGDVRHIVASPRRAAEHLAFEARVGFHEGMAEFSFAPLRGALAR